MKAFYLVAALLLLIVLGSAGCTYDPTGVVLGKNVEPTLSGTPVPVLTTVSPALTRETQSAGVAIPPVVSMTTQTQAPSTGTDWVFWRESDIDIQKGGYSMERPNLDQKYFKNLKVEVSTDAPVVVRFTTLKQADDYQKAWNNYYVTKTASSFNPQDVGWVRIFDRVSGGSLETVEAHGEDEMVIFIEPNLDQPAKGTMKIYYKL
jgi:hypothetical protein